MKILFFLISFSLVWAQSPSTLDLKNLMSPAEQKNTGVQKLSAKELQALQQWITNWTIQMVGKAASPNSTASTPPSGGLTVASNVMEGQFLKLSDGKVYNIVSYDRLYSFYWQVGDSIVVQASNDSIYPYTLSNSKATVTVNGKLVSEKTQKAFQTPFSVTKVDQGGQFVTLSDGSVWQISPSATFLSNGWSVGDSIYVITQTDVTGPAQLLNGNTSRSVGAHQIKPPVQNASKT